MKIAIYGDSFTADHDGWPFYLKNLSKSRTDNYGLNGSSVEYSYMKFLETHEQYDVILFFWTATNRSSLILEDGDEFKCKSNVYLCGNGEVNVIRENIKGNMYEPWYSKKYNNWIKNEYNMLKQFPTKNKIYHQSIRDSVKYKRPDAIHIECFSGLETIHAYNKTYGMQNIIKSQFSKFDLSEYDFHNGKVSENETKIKNHISIRQNLEFAKYLYKSILDREFDIHETFYDPQKYYTMVDTLEESGYVIG